ncbi:MAG: Era-like GTP-binding protein, partial [Cyanobacteria bacterium P01_F01_bin.42]
MTVSSDPVNAAERQSAASSLQWRNQFYERVLGGLGESLKPYQDGKAQALCPELQPLVGQLKTLEQKLRQKVLQIAVFGYVSRGKSALLNGLLGEPLLPIGAMNGVTQWPRSLQWNPFPDEDIPWKIELVDTPGLGEVAGADRAEMAMSIAAASDLILFVTAGQPNADELKTLEQWADLATPLLLVANKADLYPDLTPDSLWTELEPKLQQRIQPGNILLTAANPAAQKVRNEWPDGSVTEEWEVPPTNVSTVRDR